MIFNNKKEKNLEENEEFHIPLFGYELLKEQVLPDLLGKDYLSILYWAGKSLARKYPQTTIEEIIAFFEKAGWGQLSVVKEKRSELMLEVTSNAFTNKTDVKTPIEAGFLAEQIQTIKGVTAETSETFKKGKMNKIVYRIKWE